MRNLKRALSLTLASVMLLGMMVVGSSAASYPDVTEDNNVEAIEVIQAVGIMVGDENGNFGPDNQVTRAQMAVILAKLMDLGGYITGTNPFPDVTQEWAIPSISACYARGYISGYDNGNFGPNDPVTAVQAASMLMRALGYFQHAEDFEGGFELSTIRQAGKIDLFNGIGDANAKTELTRDQVAQMVLNTLKSGTVEADDSSKVNVNVDGIQVSVGATNYVYVTSREDYAKAINAAEVGNATATTGLRSYIVDLGEKLYQGDLRLLDDRDEFGRPSDTWEYKATKVGTYAKDPTYEYTVGVSEKDLYNRIGSIAMKYNDWEVYYNNQAVAGSETWSSGLKPDKTVTDRWKPTNRGTLTQIYVEPYANGQDGRVVICMIDTMLAEVVRVNDDNFTVTYLSPTNKAMTGNLINATRQTQIDAKNTGLSVGDRLLVRLYEDGNRFSVYDYSVAETVTGTVTSVKARYDNDQVEGSYAVMDGSTYNYVGNTFVEDLAETVLWNPTINSENTLYLDYYDNMIAFEATERAVDYLYLNAAHWYMGQYQARVTFADGTTKVVDVDKIDKWNDGKGLIDISRGDLAEGGEDVYAYRQDGSNYQLIELENCNEDENGWTAVPTYNSPYGGKDEGITDATNTYAIRKDENSIQKDGTRNVITLNKATVFVDVKGGKVYTGYADVPSMSDISFFAVYSRQLNADVVFIYDGADNRDSNSYFYVLDKKPITSQTAPNGETRAVSSTGTNYYTYSVWMDGEKTEVTLKGTNLDTNSRIIDEHTLYRVKTVDSNGYVTACEYVLEMDSVKNAYHSDCFYDEAKGSGSLRIVEPKADAAFINGAKNNIDTRYDNCDNKDHANTSGMVHRVYTYDNDTIFMELYINEQGKASVRPASASSIVSSPASAGTHKNNVYVVAVGDKTDRTPKATLVWILTRDDVKDDEAGSVTFKGTGVKGTDFTTTPTSLSGLKVNDTFTLNLLNGATIAASSGVEITGDGNTKTVKITAATAEITINKSTKESSVKFAADAKSRGATLNQALCGATVTAAADGSAQINLFISLTAPNWARPADDTGSKISYRVYANDQLVDTVTDAASTGHTAYSKNATTGVETLGTVTLADADAAKGKFPAGADIRVEITEVKYDKVAVKFVDGAGTDITDKMDASSATDIAVGTAITSTTGIIAKYAHSSGKDATGADVTVTPSVTAGATGTETKATGEKVSAGYFDFAATDHIGEGLTPTGDSAVTVQLADIEKLAEMLTIKVDDTDTGTTGTVDFADGHGIAQIKNFVTAMPADKSGQVADTSGLVITPASQTISKGGNAEFTVKLSESAPTDKRIEGYKVTITIPGCGSITKTIKDNTGDKFSFVKVNNNVTLTASMIKVETIEKLYVKDVEVGEKYIILTFNKDVQLATGKTATVGSLTTKTEAATDVSVSGSKVTFTYANAIQDGATLALTTANFALASDSAATGVCAAGTITIKLAEKIYSTTIAMT